MEYIVRHWYEFAVYIAAIVAMVLGIGTWNTLYSILLLSLILIHLHFFEEFGLPGGFIWVGLKVEPRPYSSDVSKWAVNQASCFWGNEWSAIMGYLLPLLIPQWHWAVLAALIFAYVELLMHLVVFNIGIHSWYNPGLFTAICLSIISTWYLWQVIPSSMFTWWDLILAILWCAFNYWMAFESPIAKKFTANKKYTFTREDVMKSKRYLDKFPGTAEKLTNFADDLKK